MGWAGCRAAVGGQGILRGECSPWELPEDEKGAADSQARIQDYRVISCGMPILLLMRKQAQRGMGLAWDTAEAGAGTRTQAFMPR